MDNVHVSKTVIIEIQFNSFFISPKQVNTLVNIMRKITLMEKKGICRTSEQLTETHSQKINKKC
jgi:hypothetical protein